MNDSKSICPLCGCPDLSQYHKDRFREYLRCGECGLIHVPEKYHVSRDKEKCRYDLHKNSGDDEGYRRFLMKLVDPLAARLDKGASGLDYGSGPTPVLVSMLEEKGFKVEKYDPFYAADVSVLGRRYDFLMCCETIEHFSNPRLEWERFIKLVRKGGWIGIMTQLTDGSKDFAHWHYINDETHIGYYSKKTFQWLDRKYGVKVFFEGMSVVLCQV